MTDQQQAKWERFKEFYLQIPELGLSLDVSRMKFDAAYLQRMEPAAQQALAEMSALEGGSIANRDENRMVGHYWLRNPKLAPSRAITEAIEATVAKIERFADAVATGRLKGAGGRFESLLLIGIGGSALGPQFVSRALATPDSRSKWPVLHFIDNTDPDGIDLALAELKGALSKTLCIVISKSGGTRETRNGMIEVKRAFEMEGINFEAQAVAVTGEGSELDKLAKSQEWLERFPMWDWVGGRTSELSAVGLLPAALQGIDIRGLLQGAADCDQITRRTETRLNPASMMALMWYVVGNGKGTKDMVVLPYKDRLELFSKYLQQLIMESLGKARDRDGTVVNQGLAVYGNKGSTDQHAYVQQLRDGINNFFVNFINVLEARSCPSVEVEPGIVTGDYLNGFFMGTREALYEGGRESLTVTIQRIDARTVGVLIALFERAVGLYASLVNVNAYHQPGVEAGKKAAEEVLSLQGFIMKRLREGCGKAMTAEQLAAEVGSGHDPEKVFLVCQHLAATRSEVEFEARVPVWTSAFSAR